MNDAPPQALWSPLDWQEAMTGRDHLGCPTTATIEGDGLRIRHGDNPEAVVWISFDDLVSTVGFDRFRTWCDAVHAYEWGP